MDCYHSLFRLIFLNMNNVTILSFKFIKYYQNDSFNVRKLKKNSPFRPGTEAVVNVKMINAPEKCNDC